MTPYRFRLQNRTAAVQLNCHVISRRKQTLPRSAPRAEILNFRNVFLERMEEDDEAKRKAKDRKELADFLAKVDEIGT